MKGISWSGFAIQGEPVLCMGFSTKQWVAKTGRLFFVLCFSFLFSGAGRLYAQENLLQHGSVGSAEHVSLNGLWQFRTDPGDKGLTENWPEEDLGTWMPIKVPSAFNVAYKELWSYEGVAWYRRGLQLSGEQLAGGQRVFLRFLGASLRKKVWVNGILVGEDVSPYSPFEFEITQAVHPGDNRIVLRTDTRRLEVSLPDRKWNGWWNYGGIYRDVFAEIRPPTFIRSLWMTTEMGDSEESGWQLSVCSDLSLPESIPPAGSVAFTLMDPEGKEVWKGQTQARDGRVSVQGSLAKVRVWEPGFPVLYTLVASVGSHTLTIRTAFRQISTRGSQICLNGKPITLYGINYHEDHEAYGNAIPLEAMKQDLDAIRELGCNFIRTSHYTAHPYVFDYCDKNGILVWTEIPAWKTSVESLTDEDSWRTYIAPQLTSMVREYRHHPCVVFWSVGNEFNSSQPKVAEYVRRAVSFVKQLDSTRLVTFASDKRLQDQAAAYVDVISWNEYYGWYYGTLFDIGPVLDKGHAQWPDKPILISEFGAGGPIDRPTGGGEAVKGKHYTLEYQTRFLRTHLQQIYDPKRASFVAGAAIWCYNDFADPHRHGGGHPEAWYQVNTKGLVTRDRRRKPAFNEVKQIYTAIKGGGGFHESDQEHH
ncbi:MAG: hypothetical protein DRP64_08275 [Verrucomicrobia bacterium]|nr:MAG: hypothetical protein DRP64_08275 [Verrucomicrobiota bacterium]